MDVFTKELEELRVLVASISPVNAALANHKDSLVRRYVFVRRRFDYAAFAVALYASFEKFIEAFIAEYAHFESRRLSYGELPTKLLTKHRSRTAEMLSRGRIGEGRYLGLTELEVVKNLFECLNGVKPYTLNKAAVIAHDVNLRVGEIDNLFATVGIENVCDRARRADALMHWYRETKNLEVVLQDGVPATLVEERIKDLVDRRNEIAHGGDIPTELPGENEMKEAISFMQAFAQSIFAITVGAYLKTHHAPTSLGHVELVQVQNDGPYKKGTIVVIEKPAKRLLVGQPVFVLVDSTGARWGRIQKLRVNDTDVHEVMPETDAPRGVGVELDFKCPKGANLIALETDDDAVWRVSEAAVAP
ncbi:HEPN domain-containing protein [Bradyrhizobium sp. CCGB01]|uniref:HEPN domain-containing protein n=1 Tax=Bradyrhizobium sp. CCGB01 TaxID=2949634 RepID=UPI0020B3B7DA|nr:MAE_28990/MAE_18760 family HEPN-like nuclease [Bradyrhizobium sp. CCGB01]MCP3412040.1 MAE_28990/MAE_18760 family HEPN-like nuclease [Bradyrhizobium sp. CCGB01]